MKLSTYTLLIIFLFTTISFAQLTGTKTIPGDYASIEAAITALNSLGVGTGGVTFNVAASHTETFTSPVAGVITATGTSSNTIVFQKSGAGNNPLITAGLGTTASSTSNTSYGDGIISIEGGDYITFDGIDLQDNPAATGVEKMEFGYFLKKASGDDACKNVTIKNCTITLDMTTIYSWGVYVSNFTGTAAATVTSIGGRHENIKIFNNTISNVYGGVYLRGFLDASPYEFYDQNIEIGVDGANIITNYGGGATTVYGVYALYQNNLKIANNTISGTSAAIIYGIFTSTGVNSNIDIIGNTVTINSTGTGASTLYAISSSMGTTGTNNTINIQDNIVENSSYPGTTTGAMYLLYNSASARTVNIHGNIIRNNSKLGTSGAMYLLYSSSTGVDGFANIYNNQIYGNSNGATGSTYCIYSNEVTTATKTIYNNTVYNNSGGGNIYGIYSTLGVAADIYKNNIYDLTSTTTGTASPYSVGVSISSGTNVYVYNNLISDLKAPAAAAVDAVRGIEFLTATTNATRNVYYNSIFLNASSTGDNFGSSGIYHINSTTATSSALDMRNNNVVNVSVPNGTGNTVAFRRSAVNANFNNYGEISNNNNFYAGIPGANNLIFFDGTNSDQTIFDFKSRVAPRESNSITGNPPFLNAATPPYNLHINTTVPTQLESAGIPVTAPIAVTTDFDGETRNAATPDIGADEFDGIGADLTAPAIVYTPLPNTGLTVNRSLSAAITDQSGVVTGTNGPRLYFMKNYDGSFVFDAAPTISGDDFTFTFNHASLGGVTQNDTVYYYVAAQDSADNGGTVPAGGSGINPPGTTPPANLNYYAIVPQLTGTFTVGTGGNYANLSAVAALLQPSNSQVAGDVIFELTADYDGTTEVVPIVFNEYNSSDTSFRVTIRPASGVTGRVTSGDPGSNFAYPVINFVGGKRYILDGRPGGSGFSNEWTIRNTRSASTIGCVIRFADDAAYNTLRNLNIEGQATLTTTGSIFFHISANGTIGNSFNSILYNSISGRTDTPTNMSIGILGNGSAVAPNSDNIIIGNHIKNFTSAGINLLTTNTGNGPNWVISENHIYSEAVSTTTQTGIAIASNACTNMMISGNFIGGSEPNAAGMLSNSGNVLLTGISITGGVATITGNTIANMTGTNTGTTARTRGIHFTSGNDGMVITDNMIYNLSTSSGVVGFAAGNQAVIGINVWPGSTFFTSTITGNSIFNLSADNTAALASANMAAGVHLTNFTGSFANNKIYNIKNNSTGTGLQAPLACGIYSRFHSNGFIFNNMISLGNDTSNTQYAGIFILGNGTNVHNYIYNSVNIGGLSTGTASSFGFVRGEDTSASLNQSPILRNNIFQITRTGTAENYAAGSRGAVTTGWDSDYNLLYNSDTSKIGYWINTGYNLSGWQAISMSDTNSRTKPVFFVNSGIGDLHVTGTSIQDWDLAGIPIPEITTDYDGDTRSATLPYKGADESDIIPVEMTTFTASVQKRDVHLSWSTATEVNNSGFELQRKYAEDTDTWESVSFINGNGTTVDIQNYIYVDKNLNTGKYLYRLKQIDYNGSYEYHNLTSEVEVGIPMAFNLSQNYPNPFNPATKINYDLPFDSKVTIQIYDITGSEITTLVSEIKPAGYHTADFRALNMASGVYLYRIIAEPTSNGSTKFISTKKMIMLK
jgi:trimeric autotransporter adhesin